MKLPTPTEAADQAALTTETNDEWCAFLDGVYWVMGLVKKDAALLAQVREARRERDEIAAGPSNSKTDKEFKEADIELEYLRDLLELEKNEE